ncbi:MAG TPA: endonuclease/exonuclease/phosphatase family protein [Candidatus Polarisedimenticolaceae bacterium]|nr:endonuclease/exonuclease/phosphatase family protein [Candidatus Polarisedimenticolaceae bacterium]
MRLLLWNLNHRVSKKVIPPLTVSAITAARPDVLVLTEYVEGPSHEWFVRELDDAGLSHVLISAEFEGNNRVLIAARRPLFPGPLQAPPLDSSSPPNSLHVVVPELELNVLGIRMPAFEGRGAGRLRNAWWDWMAEAAATIREGQAVLAGDLNTDPERRGPSGGIRLQRLVASGWRRALPLDGHSWWDLRGRGYRLDHVFVTPTLELIGAEYVTRFGDHQLVGRKNGFSSDHAALLVDVQS